MNPKTIFAIAIIALFCTSVYSQCTISGPVNVCKTIEYVYNINPGPDQTVRWRLVNRLGKFITILTDHCMIQWEKTGTETLLAEIRSSTGAIISSCSLNIYVAHFEEFDIKPIPNEGGASEKKTYNFCKNTDLKFLTMQHGDYSYSWTYNGIPVGNNSNTVEFNSGNQPTGELCLTVQNLINLCTRTLCIQLNLFDPPVIDFQWYGGNDPLLLNICLGDEILFTNNSVHENDNLYVWELIQAGTTLSSSTTRSINTPFLTSYPDPGNYTVRLTGFNITKCKMIKEVFVTVDQNTKLQINSIKNTVCEGEEIQYSVDDVCQQYVWAVEHGQFNPAPGNNPAANVIWQQPGPSGVGTIFVTPSNCQSSICNATSKEHVFIIPSDLDNNLFAQVQMNSMECSQNLQFTVKNPVQSPIEITGQPYICPGQEYMYSIVETSAGDVEWDIIGGTITGQPMKNHVMILWFTNQTTYQVSARWIQGDCESEWTSLAVFSKENLTAAISGPDPVCNASTTEYTINYPNAQSYTWRIDPPSVGQIIAGQSSHMVTVEWNNVSQSTQAKVIVDILDCNLSKYYELPVTVNKGTSPVILGNPCVDQSSVLVVNAFGADEYFWDFGDGTTMTTPTNVAYHIYQTEGSYFVKVSWNESSNCYDRNYTNGWVTALNQEKFDIYPYYCPINQFQSFPDTCQPFDCIYPDSSYLLQFYATHFTGISDYRWEVIKLTGGTEFYTTTEPFLELEQPVNGPYFGARIIVRTDHNTSNRKCIIPDTFDIAQCVPAGGECEQDPVTVNIIEDGWEGCTIYKYHGVIEPFNYPVKSRWWAVNDGFTNPKYEIITLADLLPRTSEFKKAGVFSVTLNATVYQTGSMVDTCITPESDVRPVIINIVPRIVSQFECSGIDYQLRAKAVGSLYSVPFPPGATYTWYKDNTSNVLGSGEEIVIPPASLSSNFTLILIGDYGGKSCTTQTNIVLPEVFDLAFQPDIKACEGSIVEFGLQGTGADQITSYYWQFGDGSFSFAANPNKVYASDGSYTITLTVKNQYGCELILTKDINVMPNNLVATIDYSLDDCMTSNTLTCQASNGTEPYQYLWSTGQTGNPIVSGQNRFFVTVTDDNGCMTVAGPKEVMTDQIFLSELIGPTSICERTSNAYTFFRNLNPIYGYSAYYLKPGDNTKYSVGSNLDPILFSVQNYTGPITLIVEAYKTSNPNEICAFIELDITVLPKPQITLAVDTISCNPRLLKIRETSNREVTWFLEQTEISTGPFILTNTAGTYTANYISPEGCVSATSRIISPNPLLHINLEGDYTLCDSSLYDNDPLSPKLFGFIDNAGVLIPISQFKLFGDETLASFEQDLGNQQTSVQPSIVLSPLMKNKYIRLWARDNYQCEYLSEPFHFLTKPCSCEAIISSQIDIIHDKTQSGYDYYNVKGIFELPDEFEICPTDGILFGKLEIVGTVETRKLSNGKTELRAYVRQAIGACDGTDTVTLAICFEELRCESTIPLNMNVVLMIHRNV
jgi:PKD repeat protein